MDYKAFSMKIVKTCCRLSPLLHTDDNKALSQSRKLQITQTLEATVSFNTEIKKRTFIHSGFWHLNTLSSAGTSAAKSQNGHLKTRGLMN